MATIANPTLFYIIINPSAQGFCKWNQTQTKQKMKRFFTMIVAACAFFAVSAQHPMVTLSHNGELSFFTNLTALESAYNAAEYGDTIYLSKGEFIVNGGKLDLQYGVSIIGNGYDSHILGDISITSSKTYFNNDVVLFDGVRLDKLKFATLSYNDLLESSEIRRCWIRSLENAAYAARNMTFDKCYIENADFFGNGTVFLKNSKLNCNSSNALYNTTAVNCNIGVSTYYPLTAISCILRKGANQPSVNGSSASLINCLLDFKPTSTSVYQHECYYIEDSSEPIFDDKMNCTLNLTESGYLGQDGNIVGIMGGENHFSENPSVPSVDTNNSSVEYDAENNKLKVSITVKAD